MADIEKRYGLNDHRKTLLNGLKRAITALLAAGCSKMYLDGSFITTKILPNDYDVCWDMAGVDSNLLDPVFFDFKNKRAAQKAKYLGEFFPAHLQAEPVTPFRIYLAFFQIDKDSGSSKGIVGIELKGTP